MPPTVRPAVPGYVKHIVKFEGPGGLRASFSLDIGPYPTPLSGGLVDGVNGQLANWLDADGVVFTDDNDLSGCYHENWVATEIEAREMVAEDADGLIVLASLNTPGRLTGSPLPPQIALCVREIGALGGRSRRGRCYLPGQAEVSSTDEGAVEPAHAVRVGVAFEALRDQLAVFTDDPLYLNNISLIHKAAGAPPEDAPYYRDAAVITPVTGFVVNDQWDTQRRRAGRT